MTSTLAPVTTLLLMCAALYPVVFAQTGGLLATVDDLCLRCICEGSTNCEPRKCVELAGGTFCGPFQISRPYWVDAGSPGTSFEECANDMQCAMLAVKQYVLKYAKNCNGDTVLDCEDIALLHKAGPYACETANLQNNPYWTLFTQCYYGARK